MRLRMMAVALGLGWVIGGEAFALDCLITGVGYSPSYNSVAYNQIVQWRVQGKGAGTTVTKIGMVNLGVGGILNYDIQAYDVAMLKDGRVAVLHKNPAATAHQVSVFTLQYDATLNLSGATRDLTVDSAMTVYGLGQNGGIAPTGDGGFAVARNTSGNVYFYAPSSTTFVETVCSSGGDVRDLAGTLSRRPEVVYQNYGAGTRSYRAGFDGSVYKRLAEYSDFLGTTADRRYMEGLRSDLLKNGWVIADYDGTGATIGDDSTLSGAVTNGILGHLYNANSTPFTTTSHAIALKDGRVIMASQTVNTRDSFYVFTLVNQGLPNGDQVGAVGYQLVENVYGDAKYTIIQVRLCGDYLTRLPPKGTVVAFR